MRLQQTRCWQGQEGEGGRVGEKEEQWWLLDQLARKIQTYKARGCYEKGAGTRLQWEVAWGDAAIFMLQAPRERKAKPQQCNPLFFSLSLPHRNTVLLP